ncbi:MAG: T9SS type A sorting domain-containing protein, partial [Chitinispirillaceae bacterium]|nr:T9SS type A sorting domain-containing protein [Chitinispirillaceae bacterium]
AASTGSFVLYEDETPKKTTLSFSYAPANQQTTVNIGAFAGSKYCSQAKRIWRVEVHCVPEVKNVTVGSTPLTQTTAANYNRGTAGWFWEAANGGVCYIGTGGASGANVSSGFPVIAAGGQVGVTPDFSNAVKQKVAVSQMAGAIKVSVPVGGKHWVEILNAQGKVITKRAGSSAADYSIPVKRNTPTMYFVKVRASGKTTVEKLIL